MRTGRRTYGTDERMEQGDGRMMTGPKEEEEEGKDGMMIPHPQSHSSTSILPPLSSSSLSSSSVRYSATPSDLTIHGRQEKARSIRSFLWNSLQIIAVSALFALFLVAFKTKEQTVSITNIYSDRAPAGVLPPMPGGGGGATGGGGGGGIPPGVSAPASTAYGMSSLLSIIATNEYGEFSDKSHYAWMNEVPGTQLVEPYKETALTLVGTMASSNAYTFTWTIQGFKGEGTTWTKSGKFQTTQKLTFTLTGKFNITVEAVDASSGNVAHSYTTLLISKYVKREIRSLTEEDKERFLKAAKKMWEVNSVKGIEKYGSEYTSIDRLVAAYSLASNDLMCDQFHEGSGYLTRHLALTNTFEASLRAIDPSVTLPYWDFTVEGEAISKAGQIPSYFLSVSPVLTSEWFGAVDERNHIVDSRWANIQIPTQTEIGGARNSYGYIRSHWNNNNDTQVSRKLFSTCGVEAVHKSIPTCRNHFAVLNASSIGAFQVLSPADGRGPLHAQLGGIWGGCTQALASFVEKWNEVLNEDLSLEDLTALGVTKWKWGTHAPRKSMMETAIVGEYFHIYRSFWRSHMCALDGTPNLLVCPASCDTDLPFEECTCQVEALVKGETTWRNLLPCVLSSDENREDFSKVMPEEMLSDLVYMLATASVKEGDMLEPSATADPLFWLIHPAIERLLAAKRLPAVTQMGSKPFSKWADVSGAHSKSSWLEYSYYNIPAGSHPVFSEGNTCYGHSANDNVLPDSLKFTEAIMRAAGVAEGDKDRSISNWDFFMALDPNNGDGNDYVFDNFDWSHCEESGTLDMAVPPVPRSSLHPQ